MTVSSVHHYSDRWQLWRSAKDFPPLVGQCDYTLTFTLGRDNFGYEYGTYKRRYTGPALDLTGATVRLHIEKMGHRPSLLLEARGEDWTQGTDLCTITGEITDAENGEVTFELDSDDSDAKGHYIGEIEVEDADEKIIVPGHIKFTFLEKLR